MAKWYHEQPKIEVEYPPHWVRFSLGVLKPVYMHDEDELIHLVARVKTTATTYIQDRELLGSLSCQFLTKHDGEIYKVILG
jgi:hypothetical protein